MPDSVKQAPIVSPDDARSTRLLFQVVTDKIRNDDMPLRASALAYSTLASLVPIFAIILAILSLSAFKETREDVLNTLAARFVPVQKETWIIADEPNSAQDQFKNEFQAQIGPLAERAQAVSTFGFIILIVTVCMVYQAAESSFNVIWRVNSERPFFLRIAIATSMLFWGPVMLAASISISQHLDFLPFVGNYVIPALLTATVFTAFFMMMPHARVRFPCALAGGFAAALLWELAKMLFLIYVTRVVSYSRVYGSLGLIPMLFLWVYINWLIILAGAELAYCLQHRHVMVEQWLAQQNEKERLTQIQAQAQLPTSIILAAAIEIARRFLSPDAAPVRLSQLSQALRIEIGTARRAAERLVAGGIIAPVAPAGHDSPDNEDQAYLPVRDPRTLDLSALLAVTYEEKSPTGHGIACDRARTFLQLVTKANCAGFGKMSLADAAAERSTLDPAPPSDSDFNAASEAIPAPAP